MVSKKTDGSGKSWRRKSEYARLAPLCRFALAASPSPIFRAALTTVDVSAATLFEAVALALKAAQGDKWAPDGFRPVKVQVLDVRAEYEVKLKDFTKWLERRGNTPREVIDRKKIKAILGVLK